MRNLGGPALRPVFIRMCSSPRDTCAEALDLDVVCACFPCFCRLVFRCSRRASGIPPTHWARGALEWWQVCCNSCGSESCNLAGRCEKIVVLKTLINHLPFEAETYVPTLRQMKGFLMNSSFTLFNLKPRWPSGDMAPGPAILNTRFRCLAYEFNYIRACVCFSSVECSRL